MKEILVVIPMDEAHQQRLQQQAPEAEIVCKNASAVTIEDIATANIIIGNPPIDLLKHAKELEWLQLNTAGADQFIKEGVLPHPVQLTNSTGAYGLAVAEHMLGMLLNLLKKLHIYRDNQNNHVWKDEGIVRSIYGSTVLIVGLGDIGNDFAKMIKALGGNTIGVKRRPSNKPEYIDRLYLQDELEIALPEADIVALCLPATADTYKLFNGEKLAKMKPGSILLNVGRGTSLDTEALCDALESGHISGAGLDVTDPEPLPVDHRLWNMENAVITPHVSGYYHLQETYERIFNIALDNLQRFLAGKELNNQVDFQTGYKDR